MLVASISSFASYHGLRETEDGAKRPSSFGGGSAWERQALIRARFCAGDAALGARVMAIAALAAYEGGPPPAEEMTAAPREEVNVAVPEEEAAATPLTENAAR